VTVRLAIVASVGDGGIVIAAERGYFQEEGIEVQFTVIDSAGRMIPLLATGQLDVGTGGLNVALINAVHQGVPVKIVADKGSLRPGFGYEQFVVRKVLVDSGAATTIADLKGKTIAISSASGIDIVLLADLLQPAGLTPDDVNVVEIPFPDMVTALANGSIDGAIEIEPFASRALQQGTAVRWKTLDETSPGQPFAVIMYAPRFVQDHPEAARRWMVGYLRGIRDYNDAFLRGVKKDEVVQILTRHTTMTDPELVRSIELPGLNPNGYTNAEGIGRAQDVWAERNLVVRKIGVEEFVDHQFVDYALGRLGRATP
jgi:NitT/TauT family transport system substrate-binding protein